MGLLREGTKVLVLAATLATAGCGETSRSASKNPNVVPLRPGITWNTQGQGEICTGYGLSFDGYAPIVPPLNRRVVADFAPGSKHTVTTQGTDGECVGYKNDQTGQSRRDALRQVIDDLGTQGLAPFTVIEVPNNS